jgi:hypothetical protein
MDTSSSRRAIRWAQVLVVEPSRIGIVGHICDICHVSDAVRAIASDTIDQRFHERRAPGAGPGSVGFWCSRP